MTPPRPGQRGNPDLTLFALGWRDESSHSNPLGARADARCRGSRGSGPAQEAQKVNVTVMTRNIYLGGTSSTRSAPPISTRKQKPASSGPRSRRPTSSARAPRCSPARSSAPSRTGRTQEVAISRRSPDGRSDGNTTPATQVVYNFLKTFHELARLGLKYSVGVVQREADIGPASEATTCASRCTT